jgi:dihydrofolate reductase
MSIDGFIGGPNGEMDWVTFNRENDIMNCVNELTDSVDTILLGRKMAEGFISYWTNVVTKPDDSNFEFAKKMVDKPKVVFTKTLSKSPWNNTSLANGELVDEINKLKRQPGKDIIVYGGAEFVSSLITKNLIDEYHISVNPVAIGKGITIFKNLEKRQNLELVKSVRFNCGKVLLCYTPSLI